MKKLIKLLTITFTFVLVLGGLTTFASDKEIEEIELGTPAKAYWETDYVAHWSSVKSASEYQIKLYDSEYIDIWYNDEDKLWYSDLENCDDLRSVVTLRVNDTECDLKDYLEAGKSYFFIVRAVPKTNEQAYKKPGAWKTSSELDYSKNNIGITDGRWRHYLAGSQYETSEGEILKSGWYRINGNWYYLDENGYRYTGWKFINNEWYYFNQDGIMHIGWLQQGDDWYYLKADGSMADNTDEVRTEPGKYYKFDASGKWIP